MSAYTVNDQLPTLRVDDITKSRIETVMRVMGDDNPIHLDEELAASLGFRGLVNQGPANMAYVVNLLLQLTGPAGVRRLQFRFLDNVVPGDRLTAAGRVTAVEGDELTCTFTLSSDEGRRMLTGEATLTRIRHALT